MWRVAGSLILLIPLGDPCAAIVRLDGEVCQTKGKAGKSSTLDLGDKGHARYAPSPTARE